MADRVKQVASAGAPDCASKLAEEKKSGHALGIAGPDVEEGTGNSESST